MTDSLLAARAALLSHPVYASVRDLPALRRFMASHVYAVWDFMALLKRLQRDLTCVALPWLPPLDPAAARAINEIVLAEESDLDPAGRPASHLELYLAAMDEVGAPRAPFARFLAHLRAGGELEQAFELAETPPAAREFVRATLREAHQGATHEVLAGFLHGREDPIPTMFRALLAALAAGGEFPALAYYLERHVELDEGEHAVAAAALLERLCESAAARQAADAAAVRAIRARLALWDSLLPQAQLELASGPA